MVRLRFVSDLHVDFMRDRGASIMREIAADDGYDVLVVAGDLCSFKGLYAALAGICQATSGRPVVYVLGNHEAYGSTIASALAEGRRASADHENLHMLERSSVELLGQRFVGCTLWFAHDGEPKELDGFMGDFKYVRDLYDQIYDLSRASRAFLADQVRPGDVVVSHHMPHARSIMPQYDGHPLNRYFVHNVSSVVERGGAALWVHGHTHSSLDYVAGDTRVVCNPFGYAQGMSGEPNPSFDATRTIAVGK